MFSRSSGVDVLCTVREVGIVPVFPLFRVFGVFSGPLAEVTEPRNTLKKRKYTETRDDAGPSPPKKIRGTFRPEGI